MWQQKRLLEHVYKVICYIRKLEDDPHGFWKTTSLIVCSDTPVHLEEFEVVEVDSIRDLI